nr:hypothetical protein [Fredinandcohnia onubensis]
MSKSFFEKRDVKALTSLCVYSAVEVSNESNDDSTKQNKIIFLTSFGFVIPEKILPTNFEEVELTPENFSRFVAQSAIKNTKEALEEHQNEDVLLENTSFILENVEIKPYSSQQTSKLANMILFSDQIVGLSFGNLSAD